MAASEDGNMTSKGTFYDVIVVGAGIIGTSAAYQLMNQGKRVLLIEQFPIPHSRGSSQGQSRAIRRAYSQLHYAKMMPESYDFWKELEKQCGQTLMKKTGMLSVAPKSSGVLQRYQKSMENCDAPYEMLSSHQLHMRYPQFRLTSDYEGQLDCEAGVLKAERALLAMQTIYKSRGGVLLDGAKMESVETGDIVSVRTTRGTFRARSVILAGGPWMKKITKDLGLELPLKPIRTLVCYWKAKHPQMFQNASFPVFFFPDIQHSSGHVHHYYGLPSDEYPDCVKVCLHTGPEINPDFRDQLPDTWDLDAVRNFIQQFMPDLEPTPAVVEKCMYTMTPDWDFIIDRHPEWDNIIIAAGFSGHGFKLAPVIGKVLGELALNEQLSYDIRPMRMDRFDAASSSKL